MRKHKHTVDIWTGCEKILLCGYLAIVGIASAIYMLVLRDVPTEHEAEFFGIRTGMSRQAVLEIPGDLRCTQAIDIQEGR